METQVIVDLPLLKEHLALDGFHRDVSGIFLNGFYVSSQTIEGGFHTRRVLEHVGQLIGENYFKKSTAGNKDELLNEIESFFKKAGLGQLQFKKLKVPEDKNVSPEYTAVLKSGVFASFPNIGQNYCFLEKELIRSAFVAFTGRLNFLVKENKCFGLGDDTCEFEITMLPI